MLKGSYVHRVGFSPDLTSEPTFHFREIIRPYSMYEITDRRTWHTVQPLERTYTIMVNGEPWDNAHANVRTTRGKDLDKMEPDDLHDHLTEFQMLLNDYMLSTPIYAITEESVGGRMHDLKFIPDNRTWVKIV